LHRKRGFRKTQITIFKEVAKKGNMWLMTCRGEDFSCLICGQKAYSKLHLAMYLLFRRCLARVAFVKSSIFGGKRGSLVN